MFFEHGLKVRLAGKAEVAADFRERLVAVGEHAFRFLQFAAGDEGANLDAKFLFKTFHHVGTAPMDVRRHVVHTDGFVGVAAYEVHAMVHVGGNALRHLHVIQPLAKIHHHVIL